MRMNKRLPAFTLMEVTIAMLISAIAISMTYTIYRIVSKSYFDYSVKQDQMADLMTADQLIRTDFFSASQIRKTESGMDLLLKQGHIVYVFDKERLMRSQFDLKTDTFKINAQLSNASFENKEAESGDRIDQVKITVMAEGRNIPYIYNKKYSSNDLFE
jgi:type II secretory pathway component PulJ